MLVTQGGGERICRKNTLLLDDIDMLVYLWFFYPVTQLHLHLVYNKLLLLSINIFIKNSIHYVINIIIQVLLKQMTPPQIITLPPACLSDGIMFCMVECRVSFMPYIMLSMFLKNVSPWTRKSPRSCGYSVLVIVTTLNWIFYFISVFESHHMQEHLITCKIISTVYHHFLQFTMYYLNNFCLWF